MSGKVHWLPLESNPELITNLMHKIGVEKGVECVDVLGFDDDLLSYIPRPCYAVLLCFPDVEKVETLMKPIYDELKNEGAEVPDGIFFMKQKITNACGTFALIHSLANNRDRIKIDDSPLKKWLDEADGLDINERSDSLAQNAELAEAHQSCARGGETDEGEEVNHHFICYVNHGNTLYEIDSRAPSPRSCGSTCDDSFLADVGKVSKGLMTALENVSFSALAIVRASD